MVGEQLNNGQRSGQTPLPAPRGTRTSERRLRTRAAWERFVSGHDDVEGVSSSVLASWHRCRDLYKVDPSLPNAPKAAGRGCSPTPSYDGVFACLGGIAATIVERTGRCVATVTDGEGRILALWGAGAAVRKAEESSLAPSFAWSETAVGTNGMGTALSQGGPLSVRGPEHWCEALHEWDCLGVAIHDSVTHQPVAALNVSSWRHEVPLHPSVLTGKTAALRRRLHERAVQDAAALSRAFVEADRHTRGALIAVDVAGSIVAANEAARSRLSRACDGLMLDPADGWRAEPSALREIAATSCRHAREKQHWVGTADLGFLFGGDGRCRHPARPLAGRRPRAAADEQRAPARRGGRAGGADRADRPCRSPETHHGRPRRARAAALARGDPLRRSVPALDEAVTDQGRVRAAIHRNRQPRAGAGSFRIHAGAP